MRRAQYNLTCIRTARGAFAKYFVLKNARRDQSNQIERSTNRIKLNPVELNHVTGFDWVR